jgi:hypothetical protein
MSLIGQKTSERLNGKNYDDWALEMTDLLSRKNLFQHCLFTSCANYIHSPAIGANAEVQPDRHEKQRWIEGEQKAKAMIRSEVESQYYEKVRTSESVKALWDSLQEEGDNFKDNRKSILLEEFHAFKLGEKESLLEGLDRLTTIKDKLDKLGKQQDDMDVCMRFKAGLPDRYEAIKQSMTMIPTDDLTIIGLKKRFANEKSEANGYDNFALRTYGNDMRKCFGCGIRGHIASNCRASKEVKEAYQKKREKLRKKEASAGNAISL